MTGVAGLGAVAAIRPEAKPSGPRPTVIDVRDHGARGDGTTNDSVALAAALGKALGSDGPAVLYFPKGRYSVEAGILNVPDGSPVIIRGDGPVSTQISLHKGGSSSGALVTLDAPFCAVEELELDGGKVTGDAELVVMNRGYNRISNCALDRAPGTALAIGKTDRAIAHVVENIVIRDAGAYGIRVHGVPKHAKTGSTDGMWSNVDVGGSARSGILLESSAQNMSNVHVWQSGLSENAGGDNHGFRVTTRSHIFSGCQTEKNAGDGFHFEGEGADDCVVSGCRVWENGGCGLAGAGTRRLTITGSTFMRNGRNNVGASASTTAASAAAISNDGGDAWAITGCSVWDDPQPLPAVKSTARPAAEGIAARQSGMSQTYAYVESNATGESTISGGVMRAEDQLSGQALQCSPLLLNVTGTDLGDGNVPTVAAANTTTLPAWGQVVQVTGNTPIRALSPGQPGRVVTLVFAPGDAGGISGSASGIGLAGDFFPTRGGSISLASTGGQWIEQSRVLLP